MELRTNYIKYSIFGKYDFLDATSANVSKLYDIFSKYNFLPNMLQMLQIQQPQNIVTKRTRPQFINDETKCIITFLPERIDIEVKEGEKIKLDTIKKYFTEILEAFPLEISRIALNASYIANISVREEAEIVRKAFVNQQSYPYGEELVEWDVRNVARKKCDELNELINVGQNITSIYVKDSEGFFNNQIKIETDINTLGELSNSRFNASTCDVFFMQAVAWNDEILKNIKGVI